jgi:hypothetical protein
MRTLALDKTFHGILTWDSVFHLSHDDQRRMFAVFRKHATSASGSERLELAASTLLRLRAYGAKTMKCKAYLAF